MKFSDTSNPGCLNLFRIYPLLADTALTSIEYRATRIRLPSSALLSCVLSLVSVVSSMSG